MKILVIGAGAVGGYFGGRLAQGGHELYFIARGDHLQAIQKDGLHVKSVDSDFHIKVRADDAFEPIESVDLIIISVKYHDLNSVISTVKKHASKSTVVMSLLNGVDSEKTVMEALAGNRVIGSIAYIGSELTAPGKINNTASGKIALGEMDGTTTKRIEKINKAFNEASIPCTISNDIQKALWEKLMWNVGFNGLAALTGKTAQEILAHKPTEMIVRSLMGELVEVAASVGIEISPKMADKHIEFTNKSDVIIPSMLQDVRHGRKTEIDIMNGKVVSQGKGLGISTPHNEVIWAAISLMDRAAR